MSFLIFKRDGVNAFLLLYPCGYDEDDVFRIIRWKEFIFIRINSRDSGI